MTEVFTESVEKLSEPRKRNVILYGVRHGEARYNGRSDMRGELTERGREQSREAGENLYADIPEGAVVEFISSNLDRAEQTVQEMKTEIERLNSDPQRSKHLVIHHGKDQKIKTFNQLAISDDHTREFFKLSRDEEGNKQDAVAVWLNNPDKTVEEMENDFRNVIRHFDRFSRTVDPGPDVYIVYTTHGGKADVVIGRLLGEKTLESLVNCEAFKISLLTTGQTTLTFREETKDIIV